VRRSDALSRCTPRKGAVHPAFWAGRRGHPAVNKFREIKLAPSGHHRADFAIRRRSHSVPSIVDGEARAAPTKYSPRAPQSSSREPTHAAQQQHCRLSQKRGSAPRLRTRAHGATRRSAPRAPPASAACHSRVAAAVLQRNPAHGWKFVCISMRELRMRCKNDAKLSCENTEESGATLWPPLATSQFDVPFRVCRTPPSRLPLITEIRTQKGPWRGLSPRGALRSLHRPGQPVVACTSAAAALHHPASSLPKSAACPPNSSLARMSVIATKAPEAPADSGRLISLAHIVRRAPSPPPLPSSAGPRKAWGGDVVRSNKDEAIAAFLARKRARGEALTPEQRAILDRFHGGAAVAQAAARFPPAAPAKSAESAQPGKRGRGRGGQGERAPGERGPAGPRSGEKRAAPAPAPPAAPRQVAVAPPARAIAPSAATLSLPTMLSMSLEDLAHARRAAQHPPAARVVSRGEGAHVAKKRRA
jgi:hypothetical protein